MAQDQTNIPADPPEQPRLRSKTLVVVGAAAVLVYIFTLGNGFVFDDIPVGDISFTI